MKSILSSKTFWLAVLQAASGIIAAVTATNPVVQTVGSVAVAKSVVDVGLRFLTSTPVGLTSDK